MHYLCMAGEGVHNICQPAFQQVYANKSQSDEKRRPTPAGGPLKKPGCDSASCRSVWRSFSCANVRHRHRVIITQPSDIAGKSALLRYRRLFPVCSRRKAAQNWSPCRCSREPVLAKYAHPACSHPPPEKLQVHVHAAWPFTATHPRSSNENAQANWASCLVTSSPFHIFTHRSET
jgi:hypothetical protein